MSSFTVIGNLYLLKSTPQICVDVEGIGIEGLRTAVAAAAASPVFEWEGPPLWAAVPFVEGGEDMARRWSCVAKI